MAANLPYSPSNKEQAFKPGPGTYAGQTKTKFMKKDPSWRFGSETRKDLQVEKMKTFQTSPG